VGEQCLKSRLGTAVRAGTTGLGRQLSRCRNGAHGSSDELVQRDIELDTVLMIWNRPIDDRASGLALVVGYCALLTALF
jgi:hypothetical protein